MGDRDHTPAAEKARADEYAELWQRIGDGGWIPGDKFCTSQGLTWQFRETPFTSEFRRRRNGTRRNRPLRITASAGRRATVSRRGHCRWLMPIARTIYRGRVPRPSAPIGAAFYIHEKEGSGASW